MKSIDVLFGLSLATLMLGVFLLRPESPPPEKMPAPPDPPVCFSPTSSAATATQIIEPRQMVFDVERDLPCVSGAFTAFASVACPGSSASGTVYYQVEARDEAGNVDVACGYVNFAVANKAGTLVGAIGDPRPSDEVSSSTRGVLADTFGASVSGDRVLLRVAPEWRAIVPVQVKFRWQAVLLGEGVKMEAVR